MRAEDRKPAKRVFPLLQNLDLDSVTFDQVQSVGDPISIEDMNEQELQDLVLVNLARLAVSGEWTGLLEAGGGNGVESVIPQASITSGYDRHMVSKYPITGSAIAAQDTIVATNYSQSAPFIAPESGDVDEIGVVVSNGHANTLRIGIYTDEGLAPKELLGYADIDTASTATVYQTSWSSTVTLVRGTVYHLMWVRLTAAAMSSSLIVSESAANYHYISASNAVYATPNAQCTLLLSGNNNDLEATVTTGNLLPSYESPLRATLKFA